MNKVDIQKLCTAPPMEWLAVHKENGKSMRVQAIDFDRRRVFIEESGYWNFSDCHLCAFTGYCDSKGEKVWRGQLVKRVYPNTVMHTETIGVIGWHKSSWVFRRGYQILHLDDIPRQEVTNIGHIHIPSEWPEEVRALLEKVPPISRANTRSESRP